MDQNEELILEDILKEFSPVSDRGSLGEAPQMPAEPASEDSGQVSGDTIRLDAIRKAMDAAMTASGQEPREFPAVHIDDDTPEPASVTEDTVAFEPKDQESGVPEPEQWESEYDESVQAYNTPEPIVFRSKSRLKELRQKLVSGPEKRYYALTEIGVGKLQAAIVVEFLIILLTAGMLALYSVGIIPPTRLRLMVFAQFLTMLVSALLGCYRMIDGVTDLFHLRFTPNTLLVLTFIVCCVDGVLCLQQLRISCCAAFSLEMVMALWAEYHRRSTELGQMDTLRRATDVEGLARVENDYEGMNGFRICQGEVEHFMDHYQQPTAPERLLNWYCLAVLAVSAVVGALGGILHSFSVGVQVCTASLLVGMPATALISTVRPMAVLEKRLHKLGTVLCGWQGIKAACSRAAVPLNDKDLFPAGAVKLNGVKFYGDHDPDLVVSYATALICANGGTLESMFVQLRESRSGLIYAVENFNHYPNGGIGGEICEDAVLVGTLEFMQDMGVDMGHGTRVSQAVYVAIDGELAGVFAITYGKAKSSVSGVRTICSSRGLYPVLTARDFMLTESFVRSKFSVNTRKMSFPDRMTREMVESKEVDPDAPVIALTTKPGLAPKAYAITGARALKKAMKVGVIVHMVGGILGLAIMAALTYLGEVQLLSPLNILLYQLAWMVPGLLITEWTRTI